MKLNETQRTILSNCSFLPKGARYSQLAIPDLDNDLFNYHLQKLVTDGFLSKENKIYTLTEQGKRLVTNIDEQTKEITGKYKVSVYTAAVVNGKILMHRRLKAPQYGYVGLPSGKMKFGENILQAANREFLEEAKLEANFRIIGNLRQIRRSEVGEVIEDGIFYVCFTDKVRGELQRKFNEGENFWVELDEVGDIDRLFKPSVEIIVKQIQDRLAGKKSWTEKFILELEPEPEEY